VDYRGGTFSSNSMGVTGLGVAYYLSDHAPSLYLTGVIGVSHWNWSGSDTGGFFFVPDHTAEASGFGVCVGGGWEIWRHWSIETSVLWGNPTGDYQDYTVNERGEIDTTFTALLLTINYVKY
jgi:hypothetical protein